MSQLIAQVIVIQEIKNHDPPLRVGQLSTSYYRVVSFESTHIPDVFYFVRRENEYRNEREQADIAERSILCISTIKVRIIRIINANRTDMTTGGR